MDTVSIGLAGNTSASAAGSGYAASPQTSWRLPQQGNRIAGLRMQHLVRFLVAPWLKDLERNVPKN
jgi:hypothetical protein